MFTPSRAAYDTTDMDFIGLFPNGEAVLGDLDGLAALIPAGLNSTYSVNAQDRIPYGNKYEWRNTAGAQNGDRWKVWFHYLDITAPENSNAENNWVVRVRRRNHQLVGGTGMVGTVSFRPDSWFRNVDPQHQNYARNQDAINRAHIPIQRSVRNLGMLHEVAIKLANEVQKSSRAEVRSRTSDVDQGGRVRDTAAVLDAIENRQGVVP